MAEHRYDPQADRAALAAVWADERTWEVDNPDDPGATATAKAYVLVMLPYPSGEPHIGHLKVYSVGDAVAHFHRRTGRAGAAADGLRRVRPAGREPRDHDRPAPARLDERRDRRVPAQFREWGISIDWSREFGTHEPRYYRWTQWIFLQLYEHGLAYRKEAAVKWCPNDQTVLANEQVIDGRCERCGAEVEAKQLEQWFFRITDYADRLLDDLDTIEWPEHVKTMQRNWIGRSEGAEVAFRCEELGIDYPVFTTRPDTLFGATFFVMAPEHPDIERLAAGTGREQEVRDYVNHALNESSEERGAADKEKTGVFLGRHVVNPVNGERLPMYVADYVLMEYGTGAIMAVPAHDERDYAFATKFDLPIRRVIAAPGGDDEPAVHRRRRARELGPGVRRAAQPRGDADRSSTGSTARARATARSTTACATGCSPASATGAARSRSSTVRPTASCPVPESDLPVLLPDVEDYAPRGRSPLAAAEDWVNTTCPRCGGPARRETDTMDTFVDSSWYFLRYCDPRQRRGRRGTSASSTTGCRSTSTSAASSTRSCT